MHSIHRLLLAVLMLLAGISTVNASVANAPGANLEISLISYGPGEGDDLNSAMIPCG